MPFSLKIIVLLILSLASVRLAVACDNAVCNKSDLRVAFYGASREDVKWATDLTNSSIDAVWQNLKEKFESQEQLAISAGIKSKIDGGSERRFSGLYIFVSTSMPKPLLKSYLREANKYGGVLVFKGLPQGSFKELTKLVIDLTESNGDLQELATSIQIDDEAYEKFKVVSVPAIVLSADSEYHPNQTAIFKFDKMIGNVGVKYSLEEFSRSGELATEALRYLND
ncbi:TrbC-like type-F conjugative transfer system pilin assembly protein (plasmid) [Candidatus Trichorickettsia mobilis]|uniref:type-F conjugative transfer system pilin assembly protein TrbC n=1 Tax=Candidatus Trichorickettsia mobilis TaxID=1346319 RepID=UPI002B26089E|nr:type-F conjugative transfer system pilin assembly protein TrbC [Candidatus Trichorickettsia mobilis]WPY01939.1 TrbC-like type-F conjugative transfer system pilin assembly protein [Candidatus Trichorickettsia mobilis]